MREHKYKAWDKKEKRWLGANLHMSVVDGLLWWQYGYECEILSAEERENIELVQYTGLKDKDGKEIYEGDIIKDYENWVGIVEWDKKDCFFNINYPIQNETMMFDDAFDSNPERNAEIIGNIYKNPELKGEDK